MDRLAVSVPFPTCHAGEAWLHINVENINNLISCETLASGVVCPFMVGYLSLKRLQLTFGYLECLGQPSMATMILWPASVDP